MKKNYLKNGLQSLMIAAILSLPLTGIAQTKIYDFEADISGTNPANVSAANGTFTTDSNVMRTNTLQLLSADTGNTAIVNLDLFPSATDYSVTWQENYVSKLGRAGMLLRGGTLTNTTNPGLKEGYLFQSNPGQGNMRIFKVASVALPASGYTGLTNVAVAAPALGANRWYRATVLGSSLKFEYSDNGTTFITAGTFTDTSYTSGRTQLASGYGFDIGNLLADNIVFTPSGTLSVAKNDLKKFTLYPNPARGVVNVLFDNNEGETSTITIYDILGKLVKTIENKLENNASIDVSSLKKGVYFLKIKSSTSEQTKKLVIN